MSIPADIQSYWWPVAIADELKPGKTLARCVHGVPLVLFRDDRDRAAALPDYCPHRFAPLSKGKVVSGDVECPYHGWRFNRKGQCTRVPGTDQGCSRNSLLPTFQTREEYNLIWVRKGDDCDTPPAGPAQVDGETDAFFMTDTVRCSMEDAAENFLDGFHTHFVHAGWIRRDAKRQRVLAKVRRLPDGVEAHYTEEGLQSGLISTLFERERGESMGRFRLPCLAEIEYRDKGGKLNLLISAWLTPESEGTLRIHARISTPRGLIPAAVKNLFLHWLFGIILKQDKAILEQTSQNMALHEQNGITLSADKQMSTKQDLLGPLIRRLIAGDESGGLEEQPVSLHL